MQTRNHIENNTIQPSKAHIERLRARRSAVSDNTTTVANMISQQMHQLFHDPKCFIYEIIQNAEDAEADSIAFKIENDDLIISYNGKPFQEHDIERVCDASRDNDPDLRAKSNQSEKIGYKGIGFKSVFGISSEITILSPKTDYFFQFSKSYWDTKTTEIKQEDNALLIRFPWQLIPLWLEPEEYNETAASTDSFEENVTIILKNVDYQKIVPELMAFVMLDERLVFLNKIQKIEFFHTGNYYSIQKTHEDSLCKITHTQRNARGEKNYTTLWHMHRATVPVEEDITEKLARLDLSSCPEKIKSAKNTEITFASKIELLESGEYDFLPPMDSKLYCYLPTSIDCHLPFLVNARFILNQDRSMIINNTWNSFVIKSIAIQHLKWLGELALNPRYSTHILKLFSPKKAHKIFPQLQRKLFQDNSRDETAQTSLLRSYEEGVTAGERDVAFIPAKDGTLLSLNEYRIDTTGFFTDIDEQLLDKSLVIQGRSRLVAYTLQNRDALVNPASEYNFHNLLENIEQYFHLLNSDSAHIEIRSKIMLFILKSDNRLAFFEKKIMMCASGQFHSPNDSFILPVTSNFTPASLAMFQINLVDLTLYSQECVKKLSKAIDKVSATLLIKKQIIKMIQQDRINENNSISILRFVYSACVSDSGTVAILQEVQKEQVNFSQFKVLTGDGKTRELKQCFLPLTPDDEKNHKNHQLSSTYFRKEEDDNTIWIKLLTSAKIITSTELAVKDISYGELEQFFKRAHQDGDVILEYTKHILDQVPNSVIPPVVRKDFKERLFFSNFIYFPFMFDLNDPNTLSLFLNKLNANHGIFSQTPRITGRKHGSQIDQIEICEHFLTYYFKNNILIKVKGTQKSLLAGSLFYLPELLDNFEPDKLPIKLADLPVQLSAAAASFLGFRLSITLKEGLKLLSTLNREIARKRKPESVDFDRLKAIYRLIIKIDLTREDVSTIGKWKDEHSLLSQAKTFEPSVHLKVFDQSLDDGLTCPDTVHWLHDVGLSNSELKTLASILHITCYSEDETFTANVSNVESELASAENLKRFILSLLPALTLIEHKEYGISTQPFHIKLFDDINALSFEYCSDIIFNNGYKPVHFARILENHLYFTGRLMHLKVCEILSMKLQSKRAQEWLKNMMQLFPSEQGNAALIKKGIQDIAALNPAIYDQLSLYQTSKTVQSSSNSESNTTTPVMTEEEQLTPLNRKVVNSLFSSPTPTAIEAAKNDNSTTSTSLAKVRSTLFDFDPDSPVTKNPRHINQERHLRPLGNKPMNMDNFAINNASNTLEVDEEKMAEKEAVNKSIGDRGEEFVFRKIAYLLEKQWGVTPKDVIINDPELGQGINACRFINVNGLQLDLIWYNRDRRDLQTMESPVDMIIAVNGEQKYFIEIKSTTSKSFATFFLTANEWKYMQAKRQKSILVRAYNVNEVKARFEVYQDPFGMICENLITFAGDGKFELKIKSPEEAREHIFEEDSALGCKVS